MRKLETRTLGRRWGGGVGMDWQKDRETNIFAALCGRTRQALWLHVFFEKRERFQDKNAFWLLAFVWNNFKFYFLMPRRAREILSFLDQDFFVLKLFRCFWLVSFAQKRRIYTIHTQMFEAKRQCLVLILVSFSSDSCKLCRSFCTVFYMEQFELQVGPGIWTIRIPS